MIRFEPRCGSGSCCWMVVKPIFDWRVTVDLHVLVRDALRRRPESRVSDRYSRATSAQRERGHDATTNGTISSHLRCHRRCAERLPGCTFFRAALSTFSERKPQRQTDLGRRVGPGPTAHRSGRARRSPEIVMSSRRYSPYRAHDASQREPDARRMPLRKGELASRHEHCAHPRPSPTETPPSARKSIRRVIKPVSDVFTPSANTGCAIPLRNPHPRLYATSGSPGPAHLMVRCRRPRRARYAAVVAANLDSGTVTIGRSRAESRRSSGG